MTSDHLTTCTFSTDCSTFIYVQYVHLVCIIVHVIHAYVVLRFFNAIQKDLLHYSDLKRIFKGIAGQQKIANPNTYKVSGD